MTSSKERSLGSWARRVEGVFIAEPQNEQELIEVINVLADRQLALHRDIVLSRARLTTIEAVAPRSMTVKVEAGVVLNDLETNLVAQGFTLGSLSPEAMKLRVGEFLEGPYGGLRAIAGGRLEPLCTSLTAITAEGRKFETPLAPRSAAGPDLNALILGAGGRLALVTRAVLRCRPLPELSHTASFTFSSSSACIEALQRSLAEGFLPGRVTLTVQQNRISATVYWAGSQGSVQRDCALLDECVFETGVKTAIEYIPETGPVGAETECSWDEVRAAVNRGETLELFRLSLSTVVACGALQGLALHIPPPWPPEAMPLLSLDSRRVFGGMP